MRLSNPVKEIGYGNNAFRGARICGLILLPGCRPSFCDQARVNVPSPGGSRSFVSRIQREVFSFSSEVNAHRVMARRILLSVSSVLWKKDPVLPIPGIIFGKSGHAPRINEENA